MFEILTRVLYFRVLLLGSGQVGKSSLCAQFMSSDHVNTYLKVGELAAIMLTLHTIAHKTQDIFSPKSNKLLNKATIQSNVLSLIVHRNK